MSALPFAFLRDVARVDRIAVEPDAIEKGTCYVGLENVKSGGDFLDVRKTAENELASTKFSFTSEHVLFGKLRPYLAKIALPDFCGVCSTDILPILPGPNMDRRYLAYFLRQPQLVQLANSRATGASLPRISSKAIEDFIVPVPELSEQKRIANILDKTEFLRRKRRAAIANLDLLAESIFFGMFGDIVTNDRGWDDRKELIDCAEVVSGFSKGRDLFGKSTSIVPYLTVANVQDKFLKMDGIKTDEATNSEVERYRLKKGDLLLTEGGDPDKLGRGTLWNDELPLCIHQNHVFRVRLVTGELTPIYLNWLVGSPRGKRYFLSSAKQTTGIASINSSQLKKFPLLIPPLELQKKFERSIEKIEQVKSAQKTHLSELDMLFASLQHRAFRGEL